MQGAAGGAQIVFLCFFFPLSSNTTSDAKVLDVFICEIKSLWEESADR